MLLSMLEVGESAVVTRVSGDDAKRRHLADLGFIVGERITVVNKLGGNLIVALMEGRVGIAEELARCIHIYEEEKCKHWTMSK